MSFRLLLLCVAVCYGQRTGSAFSLQQLAASGVGTQDSVATAYGTQFAPPFRVAPGLQEFSVTSPADGTNINVFLFSSVFGATSGSAQAAAYASTASATKIQALTGSVVAHTLGTSTVTDETGNTVYIDMWAPPSADSNFNQAAVATAFSSAILPVVRSRTGFHQLMCATAKNESGYPINVNLLVFAAGSDAASAYTAGQSAITSGNVATGLTRTYSSSANVKYNIFAAPPPTPAPFIPPTPPPTPGPNLPVRLGAGIGVGLGVPIITCVILCLFCHCRKPPPKGPVQDATGKVVGPGEAGASTDAGSTLTATTERSPSGYSYGSGYSEERSYV